MRTYPAIPVLGAALALISFAIGAAGAPRADFHAPAMSAIASVGSMDERFGVPTFLWATRPARSAPARSPVGPHLDAEPAARAHLARIAPFYRLTPTDVASARVRHVHDTGRGGIIVTYEQTVDGVEVFGEEIKLLMDRAGGLVAASGFIASGADVSGADASGAGEARAFRLTAAEAVDRALADFGGGPPSEPARVKPVFFHRLEGLEPAFYVELVAGDAADSYVISARDGAVLFRHDLIADVTFSYRVWADGTAPFMPLDGPEGSAPTPHPTATPVAWDPPFVASNLVTLQNGPISTNDPWLAPSATETTGNNVDAYADLVSPDGFSAGDARASVTGANAFDRVYDPAQAPGANGTQTLAAVTQLFYTTNFLHDWYYDAGFNEAAGNAQVSNYGRGGIPGDPLRAEAQDYLTTNNATMLTPSDGGRPRMQMFVFNPTPVMSLVVTSPPSIAGSKATGRCLFAPLSFAVSGSVVLADDGSAPTSDACGPIVNAVAGRIVLIDRGSCAYATQIQNAQNAGAIGVLLVNNAAGAPPTMSGTPSAPIAIGVYSISQPDGDAIRAELATGVAVTMSSAGQLARDGTLDNQTSSHEWGHYLTNRLIGNSNGLVTNQSRGLGEGWSDFVALLLTVRGADATVPANQKFKGTYAFGGYPMSPSIAPSSAYYFGLRRYPYSTDPTKNPLTFRHVTSGVPLPAGPPVAFGANGGYNAEIHNTGEVWCSMLWECYAALLRDTDRLKFLEAQWHMRDALVAACKMTPLSPTLTEARDALLAVAYAADPEDYRQFAIAFAARGAGIGAVSPARDSQDNSGVVESFVTGGALSFVSATLVDDVLSCDGDGSLDEGEIATLRIELANRGSVTLSSTTATVTCSNPAVVFPSGNGVSFPVSNPFETTEISLPVYMNGASGLQSLEFRIAFSDPDLVVSAPEAVVTMVANADTIPSSTETVELPNANWTIAGNPLVADRAWRRSAIGTEYRFVAPDPASISDQWLVTPSLEVAASGAFSFTFRHRHAFEVGTTDFRDGGVIEISDNGGASWTDIGGFATPGYGGAIYAFSGNPLGGRLAFVGRNVSYPALEPVTVNLGAGFAGRTVRIRFRVGADGANGDAGWELDDLAFSNLVNRPFTERIPEPDVCAPVAAGAPLPSELSFGIAGAHPTIDAPILRFGLPRPARVVISIFDVRGRKIATVADGDYPAGFHTVTWASSASRSRPGVYFARLVAEGLVLVERIVHIK